MGFNVVRALGLAATDEQLEDEAEGAVRKQEVPRDALSRSGPALVGQFRVLAPFKLREGFCWTRLPEPAAL